MTSVRGARSPPDSQVWKHTHNTPTMWHRPRMDKKQRENKCTLHLTWIVLKFPFDRSFMSLSWEFQTFNLFTEWGLLQIEAPGSHSFFYLLPWKSVDFPVFDWKPTCLFDQRSLCWEETDLAVCAGWKVPETPSLNNLLCICVCLLW